MYNTRYIRHSVLYDTQSRYNNMIHSFVTRAADFLLLNVESYDRGAINLVDGTHLTGFTITAYKESMGLFKTGIS